MLCSHWYSGQKLGRNTQWLEGHSKLDSKRPDFDFVSVSGNGANLDKDQRNRRVPFANSSRHLCRNSLSSRAVLPLLASAWTQDRVAPRLRGGPGPALPPEAAHMVPVLRDRAQHSPGQLCGQEGMLTVRQSSANSRCGDVAVRSRKSVF